jgi:hypothetical protein
MSNTAAKPGVRPRLTGSDSGEEAHADERAARPPQSATPDRIPRDVQLELVGQQLLAREIETGARPTRDRARGNPECSSGY